MRILGRKTSINVQKVMWLVAELELEVERVDIGGPFGGNDTPEYLAKNPNGLVPTLEDGDFILWESHSIVRYLSEKYGRAPWSPEDATGRAAASQWMDWYLTKMHPHMTVIFWALIRTAPEGRDYLTGSEPTIADIPVGCSAARWFTMEVERPALPRLEAWYERIKDRPGYQDHVIMPLE